MLILGQNRSIKFYECPAGLEQGLGYAQQGSSPLHGLEIRKHPATPPLPHFSEIRKSGVFSGSQANYGKVTFYQTWGKGNIPYSVLNNRISDKNLQKDPEYEGYIITSINYHFQGANS